MEEFMIYMANVTIFSCGLFLLFAGIEFIDNKIHKAISKKKTKSKIIKMPVRKESHFYDFKIS